MQTLRVIFSNKDKAYRLEKDFSVSCSTPDKGRRLLTRRSEKGGHVFGDVRYSETFLDENITRVWCEVSLRTICTLVMYNMGWALENGEGFKEDKDVQAEFAKLIAEG